MPKKVTLSKLTAWILLTILVSLDAFLDVNRGVEGNPFWQPIINNIGINYTPILVPPFLFFLYFVVKISAWLERKIDKIQQSERLVLTILVIIYALFDIWVISVDFLNFRLIKSHYHLIPILMVVGIVYGLWAERHLKKKN